MKQLFVILATITVAVSSALAQVTIPFDVPLPTWKGILTSETDDGPCVFKKANASSDNLIEIEAGEDIDYRWEAPSMYLEPTESKFTIKTWMQLPYITTSGPWAEVEVYGGNGSFTGWAVSHSLKSLKLINITTADLEKCTDILYRPQSDGIYVIAETYAYPGESVLSVGKLKDGYVVCPYSCKLEWADSIYPGILNGKIGSAGADLSKFTLKDIEYVLAHAKEPQNYVFYGYVNEEGERQINGLYTDLLGTPVHSDDNQIYTQVEQQAAYPGGTGALLSELVRNIRYPARAAENNVQGRVMVRFVIEKDGSISNAEVIQKVDSDLDREALRVVKLLTKKAIPGKINGKPVRSYYTVPLNFKLNSK